jgi:hypothetical protein
MVFLPEGRIDEKNALEKIDYRLFMDQGHAIACGDLTVDYGVIEDYVFKLEETYGVKVLGLGYDRFNALSSAEKWSEKYPNAMKRWERDWDVITPIFKFSANVRTVIYTTNAIESLNATYRKLNRQRSVFPSDQSLLKALYLATFEATKKWSMPIRNWGQVYGELSIMYEDRLPE